MPRLASLTSQALIGLGITRTVAAFAGEFLRTISSELLNAFGTTNGDFVGNSLAANGGLLAISAGSEDSESLSSTGAVYLVSIPTGEKIATILPPVAITAANFGFGTVAMNNTQIAVGHGDYDNGSGRAYIYDRLGQLISTIENPNAFGTTNLDQFGSSVALSNSYLLVGAIFEDDVSGFSSGKAYLFDLATYTLQFTFDNPNSTNNDDLFGGNIALTDTHAIIAARQEDVGQSDSGTAYIYSIPSGELLYTINNPDPIFTNSQFGRSVVIDQTYFAVSSTYLNQGRVYVYELATGDLLYFIANPNIAGDTSDNFGVSLSLANGLLVVGASGEDTEAATNSGAVFVYDIATGDLLHTLINPNIDGTAVTDQFGLRVCTDGKYVIGSAPPEDDVAQGFSSVGAVYIWE